MFVILVTVLATLSVSMVSAASATPASVAAACVTGTPVNSTYMIDYAEVTAPIAGTEYDLDTTFQSSYQVGSIMVRINPVRVLAGPCN